MVSRLITSLGRFFKAPLPAMEAEQARAQVGHQKADSAPVYAHTPTIYPPVDHGLAICPVENLIADNADLEARMYRAMGFSREDFHLWAKPVLRNLAAYVHLLPATANDYHHLPGGLLRLCMETALYSLQAANTAVFPVGEEVEKRYWLQPRWAIATWLAGLCAHASKAATDMLVVDDKNRHWQPFMLPLHPWLVEGGGQTYFVRWSEASQVTAHAFISSHIITKELLSWISKDNQDVVPALMGFLSGTQQTGNPIADIVTPMMVRVIEQNRKRTPSNYGKLMTGSHLEPHIISAMRRLVAEGVWAVGGERAIVHVGQDGVFIDWRAAVPSMLERLGTDGVRGIPSDQDTLADILISAGVFVRAPSDRRYWVILPDGLDQCNMAVKLLVDNLIFQEEFNYGELAKTSLTAAAKQKRELQAAQAVHVAAATPGAVQPLPRIPLPTAPPKPPGTVNRNRGALAPDATPPDTAREETRVPVESEELGAMDDMLPLSAGNSSTSPTMQHTQERTEPAQPATAMASSSEGTKQPKKGGGEESKQLSPPQQNAKNETAATGAITSMGDDEDGKGWITPACRKALQELRQEHSWLMTEILQNLRDGKLTGRIFMTPNGVAITHEELTSHGQDVVAFIDALAHKQWLWVDRTRPNKNLHVVENNGKTERVIVVRKERAATIGLVPKG